MTQEEKQLLLKDLCARLPYGVYVKFKQYNEPLCLSVKDALAICNGGEIINDLQYLYLRPMYSMTEEERKNFIKCAGYEVEESENGRHYDYYLKDFCGTEDAPCANADAIDWLNEHHFDYRGLINKGLALEAPKDIYKEK